MGLSVETTKKFSFSPREIQDILARHITTEFGISVDAKEIRFSVSDGDPGGFGSWGDPKHVYNPPTGASFNGASVQVTVKE